MSALTQTIPRQISAMAGRRELWWLYAVCAVLVFFLFTHQRNETACNHNVTIYGAVELQMNCDTNSINNFSHDPAKIFTEYHNWKGRPVYLAYGILGGQALMPFVKPVWTALVKPWAHMKAYAKTFSKNIHIHLAFIILNIGVVIYAAKLGVRLTGMPVGKMAAVTLAAAIASFDMVHGGVFMFHTNLFNLLSALGAGAYVSLGIAAHFQTRVQNVLLGLLVGIGILVYPALAILAPAYLMGMLYSRVRFPHDTLTWAWALGHYALFAISVAILPVFWLILNSTVFASDVYLTIDKGQFIWLLNAFYDGNVRDALALKWAGFSSVLWPTFSVELALVGLGLGLLALSSWKDFWKSLADPIVYCIAIAALGVLSFNFFQGYYVPRMQVSVIVLGYVLIARTSYALKRETLGTVSLAAILAYQLVDAVLNASSTT